MFRYLCYLIFDLWFFLNCHKAFNLRPSTDNFQNWQFQQGKVLIIFRRETKEVTLLLIQWRARWLKTTVAKFRRQAVIWLCTVFENRWTFLLNTVGFWVWTELCCCDVRHTHAWRFVLWLHFLTNLDWIVLLYLNLLRFPQSPESCITNHKGNNTTSTHCLKSYLTFFPQENW